MAQQGQLGARKVTEEMIFRLLDGVSEQYETGTKTAMKFTRPSKGVNSDSDSDTDSD
jgi:hypothetical protein